MSSNNEKEPIDIEKVVQRFEMALGFIESALGRLGCNIEDTNDKLDQIVQQLKREAKKK